MQSLKSLFITVLVLGGAFLAYDYFVAPPEEKMVFKQPAVAKSAESDASAAMASTESASAPVPSPAPPPPTPESVNTAPPPMPQPPAPAPAPPVASSDTFTPPALPSVEQATANWTRVPASAFPRQVKLLLPVAFKASYGGTQMPAGSEVTALSLQNGSLLLAPTPASAARASVTVDSTDLKASLTTAYNAWRERRIEEARIAWKNRDRAPVVFTTPQVAADGKPQISADGTFPLLLASMRAGMVTEVTPNSITRWGNPEKGDHNGKPCWVVAVDYDAQTAFGKFSTTAVAKIVDGRVAGWYYKGSGEQVP
ncbi:hypothetical protein DES53_101371 [Roseimicrobium gellanilyticum]|uniref:Uncharacterized protein n=1 Tax=Roseimicrobium gellanilyticum TaxID=748857 RepID=A0A366HVI6_9BACT|nr:hypothetical protein [Roseimicrobium gellanilyticum]RBP47574.1 hypothetical protein DES53_101371 [Roseimicrobium gellanilyticum]